MNCDFDFLSGLDERTQDVLITRALRQDDGAAAQEHLSAGRPIYYCDDDFDEEDIVREWPNGSREIVDIDDEGHVSVVACVIPKNHKTV